MLTTESYIKLKNVNSVLSFGVILMGRRLRIPRIYSLEQFKEEEALVFIVIAYDPEHLQDDRK